MIGRKSQCSNCGKTFVIQKETQVLFCQETCEHVHDLFKEVNHHLYECMEYRQASTMMKSFKEKDEQS